MKLLIADDHPIVRNGIKDIIEDISASFEIDEAEDAHEVIQKVISNDYDIIILDISMPGGGGLNALKQIKMSKPDTKVLMLSIYDDQLYINRALKAGASGYLTKSVASDELELAIKKILAGEKYLSSEVAGKMASFIYSDKEKQKHELLSEREYQVFLFIVQGHTNSEIAEELHISPKTVSTYRDRIMDKMDMSRNSELIHYALKNKLID
ncbi:MAG: DNA-binding response regulator [Bacteroidetes bacterium]|nr:MAG: DNA-binding response regulator [Bacteroidota bacterium]RLD48476.1 MAG: DNA-binding response regulator [Bacteroidota bacterium]RLD74267.1 MAG: DNA-binding response regulator [Bacteroidota bacterium]RLD89340.1 MAG: DNA-binding response regulator [Bacteroidota bacterium]